MGSERWTIKVKRFWSLGLADKGLFLRAVAWLAVARVWLARAPFPDLAERLSAKEGTEEPDPELLRRVAYAVAAAAGNVPWRSDCFPKAIAANKLLSGYGYASTIHLGVDKESEGQLLAHAWLTCGDTVVTGGEDLERYTEMLAL